MNVTKKQLQDKVYELSKQNEKYQNALHEMAFALTNKYLPPSEKITQALNFYTDTFTYVKIIKKE